MLKKFTKLSTDNRYYCYIGGSVIPNGEVQIPMIRYYTREKGSTSNGSTLTFAPTTYVGVGGYNYFIKIPKGNEIRFGFYPLSNEAATFKYLKSEKLGINLTNITANTYNYTDWVEVTDDVFDIEIYSYKESDSNGSHSGGSG